MVPVRVKVISENPEEVSELAERLRELRYFFNIYGSADAACENSAAEPADAIIVNGADMTQGAASQLQKLEPNAQILVYLNEKKVPNYVKVAAPLVLFAHNSAAEIKFALENAVGSVRKSRRLLALQSHQKKGWNFEYNPALHFITSLVKKCTVSEKFPDILEAILTFRNVIEFQDCSLLLFDHEGNPLQALHSPGGSSVAPLDIPATFSLEAFDLDEPKAVTFNSSEEQNHPLSQLTKHPWCSALAIAIRAPRAPKRPGFANIALLVLYRRKLLPFPERDQWLLELSYGPLSLALEKVVMLKAIGQASKEWRSTFDGISEPLTVIDNEFRVVKANKAFANLIGQNIKNLKHKRCYTLLAGRRSPCPACPALLEESPHSGTRLQLGGKENRDLLVWSYGIRTGLESYHFQFYRDVSKETALSSALIQSEKLAALGRLVGAIAHEINNPIAGILATSQILLGDPQNISEEWKSDLREIKDAAWRSKKIIDDLLGFTEGSGKPLEETDIRDVVKAALTFSKSGLREIRVETDLESCCLRVSVSSLQQVLFNLITNAAQAMDGRGNLRIKGKRAGGALVLTIEDNGPGIPAERLEHIFDPFYTSKKEGSGTGLGLSIVKNLAEKIGAAITVESKEKKGTKFLLQIPLGEKG